MASFFNNNGTLECSGTDVTSAQIYAALIAEGIGTGHVEDTTSAKPVYIFNAPLRVMAGAAWDFSNQIVINTAALFEVYGSVVAGSDAGGGNTSNGGVFIYNGTAEDTFRLFNNGSFKMFGGTIYSSHRVRLDSNIAFWLINCDGQLLDSASVGEFAAYGTNQDIRYDYSDLHDASAVGIKLYSFSTTSFSLVGTKVRNCLYAFQTGGLSLVLADLEIDSCTNHIVANKGDNDLTFLNPDFTVLRPFLVDSNDITRIAFRYQLNVLDAANSPIAGAAVIIRDQSGEIQSNSTTDASGNVSDLPFSAEFSTAYLYNATYAGSTRTDRAVTTRSICKYGYLIRQDTFTVDSDFIDNANLVANQQISLTEAAASALTEVSSPAEAIAAINKYIQDNYNEESDLPVFIDDGALNCRDNTVVFDATAAQVVAYSGGTLTLKATLFNGLVITTSTVSTVNGAVQTGGIIDSNGDSFLQFEAIDSWIVYASAANRDSNTAPLDSGAGSEIYRFTFSGGTTYYLRLTTGTDIIFKDVTPVTSGATLVSLGTSALLGNINASIQESSKLAEYDGRATIDLIAGTNSTEYPYGTVKEPALSIANALVIAADIGVKRIEIRGDASALPQEVVGYKFEAGFSSAVGAKQYPALTVSALNGAKNCEFDGFEITGALDDSTDQIFNELKQCVVKNLSGVAGLIERSKLAGIIQVTHSLDIKDSYGTFVLNASGANANVSVPDFSGAITVAGMTSANARVNLGFVAGLVIIDSSCTAGEITIANQNQIVGTGGGVTITIIEEAGGAGEADWTAAERAQIRDALGVDGTKVTAVGGQLQSITGGGDDAATIYTYFTAGTRADAFKATGFSTFNAATDSVTVGAMENGTITSSVIANNAFTNSAFTTGYYNTINSELDTALADYDAPTKAELDAALAALQAHGDITWQTATGFSTFNPATDTVSRVALVDLCTQNTDMRGTDGANTVPPDNAAIVGIGATVELLAQYNDNDSGLFLADGVTPATPLTAQTVVTFGADGTTPLKTVRVLGTDGNPTTLPNWSRYEKV